jgi:hypothetical protein
MGIGEAIHFNHFQRQTIVHGRWNCRAATSSWGGTGYQPVSPGYQLGETGEAFGGHRSTYSNPPAETRAGLSQRDHFHLPRWSTSGFIVLLNPDPRLLEWPFLGRPC